MLAELNILGYITTLGCGVVVKSKILGPAVVA